MGNFQITTCGWVKASNEFITNLPSEKTKMEILH
jgi:hypothetical protein